MSKSYKVLTDGLTVHRKVAELQDPVSGRVIGIQQGSGQVCHEGDILAEAEVSPTLIEALENEDNPAHESVSKKLEAVSDKPGLNEEARLGLPFAGYGDLSEEEILAAMTNLPSAAITNVKDYEASQDEPREAIANYDIGYGQSSIERQMGSERVVSPAIDGDGEEKPTAEITTREVPEEGPVQAGEGFTGSGDPQKPYGSTKSEGKKASVQRRSRRGRGRAPKAKSGQPKGQGGGSLEQQNE